MAGRRSSRVQNLKVFLLSGFETTRRKDLGRKIQSLGGKYVDTKDFNAGCTHVLCENLSRSEKFLGACATGKWVLHPQYIDDACIAESWLDEEQYEWCDDHIYKQFKGDYDLAITARRWRFLLGGASSAFSGWKVAVVVAPKKALVIKRLLAAGGAEIYNIKLPVKNPGKVADSIDYIFVSANMMHLVAHLIDYGALLVKPEFIADFLIKEPQPDPMDYLVKVDDASTISDNSQPLIDVPDDDSFLMTSQRSLYLSPPKKQTTNMLELSQGTPTHQIPFLNLHTDFPVPKDTFIHSQPTTPRHTAPSGSAMKPTRVSTPSTSDTIPSMVIKTERFSPLKTPALAASATISSQNVTGSSTLSLIEVIDLTGSDDETNQDTNMESASKDDHVTLTDHVTINDHVTQTAHVTQIASAETDVRQTESTPSHKTYTASTPDKSSLQKKHLHIASLKLKKLQEAVVGMSPITKFFKPAENGEYVRPVQNGEGVRPVQNGEDMRGKDDKATSESKKLPEQNKGNCKSSQETTRNKRKSTEMDYDKISSEPVEKRRVIRQSMPLKPIEKIGTRASSKTECAVRLDYDALNNGTENKLKKLTYTNTDINSEVHADVSTHKDVVDRTALFSHRDVGTNKTSKGAVVITRKRKHTDELYDVLHYVKRRTSNHCEWHTTDIVNLKQRQDRVDSMFIANASTEIIHTGLEDGDKSVSLWYLGNHISLKTYPQPRTVAALINDILLSGEDEQEAAGAYYVLRRMVLLHPPVTEAIQNVYLHSFTGTQVWQDTQVGAEWEFISKCLSAILSDNDESSRWNRYLFMFIISILQANMQRFVIDADMRADVGNKNMLIRIIWCPSYHVQFNSRCRQLLQFMSDTIQLCKQHNDQRTKYHMLEVLDGILWLVAMVTECARMQDSGCQDNITALQRDHISVFVHEIAKILIDLDIRDSVLLQTVFQSLRLPWLRVGICQQMLHTLDDYLLVDEQDKNIINLLRIVSYYFFLLPQFDTPHTHLDNESPARVRTMSSRKSSTDVSNGVDDSNMNKENIDKLSSKVNKKNSKGETSLHTACIRNNVAQVRKLLKLPGIDVNARDNAGWTPLHEACNHGHTDCVRELLKFVPAKTVDTFFNKGEQCRKVNLLAANDDGITPLHDAVLNSRLEVCTLLLQHGGRTLLNPKTVLNYTPLDLCGSDEMYNILSSYNTAKHKASYISGSQDSNSSCEDNTVVIPNNSAYEEVLYLEDRRVYANTIKVQHYINLVTVLVRNYIHAKHLIHVSDKLKQTQCKSRCEGMKKNCDINSSSCSYEDQICSVRDKETTVHVGESVVTPGSGGRSDIHISESDITLGSAGHSDTHVTPTDVLQLKQELKMLRRFKCYIALFRNHLKKISAPGDHGNIEDKMLELDCIVELFT